MIAIPPFVLSIKCCPSCRGTTAPHKCRSCPFHRYKGRYGVGRGR